MATRRKFTSLRSRLAWTLACAATIGLVSLVSIVVYRSKKPTQPQEPGLLASADAQSITDNASGGEHSEVEHAASAKFAVVPAAAVESDNDNSVGDKGRHVVQSAVGEFVEQSPGTIPAGNYHSIAYGYTVALSGTAWTRWDDLAEVVPEAEWGALLNNYGRFLVLPVVLADATTPAAKIDRTLLAQFGFEHVSQPPAELENFERQGAEGHAFRLTREISGRENVYRIWIVRRERMAYLVAAWIDRTAAANLWAAHIDVGGAKSQTASDSQLDAAINAQLDDVLGRFKLDDLAGPVGEQTPANDRRGLRHAMRVRPQPAAIEN